MNEVKAPQIPFLIEGGLSVDDRGRLAFVNGFSFEGVKRFYVVTNHRAGFIRAWHAHRREGKYVTVPCGAAVLGAVAIDDWEKPSKSAKIYRYVLSEQKPSVMFIPPGYANGAMSLTAETRIIYFSTASIEDSQNDDVRYDSRYWDIWQVVER